MLKKHVLPVVLGTEMSSASSISVRLLIWSMREKGKGEEQDKCQML